MPIFILEDTDIQLKSISSTPCETLELADALARKECSAQAACGYDANAKKLWIKSAGFCETVRRPGFTVFVFESGAALQICRSLQKVQHAQAEIFAKGLPRPDEFQQHALDTVASWGLGVVREFSQEYGERGADRVGHLQECGGVTQACHAFDIQ